MNLVGETAMSILISKIANNDLTDENKKLLDKLISLGGNPGLFGVDSKTDSPLFIACVNTYPKLAEWLLEVGVNPFIPVLYDFYIVEYNSIIEWVESHYNEDDCLYYPEYFQLLNVFKLYNTC